MPATNSASRVTRNTNGATSITHTSPAAPSREMQVHILRSCQLGDFEKANDLKPLAKAIMRAIHDRLGDDGVWEIYHGKPLLDLFSEIEVSRSSGYQWLGWLKEAEIISDTVTDGRRQLRIQWRSVWALTAEGREGKQFASVASSKPEAVSQVAENEDTEPLAGRVHIENLTRTLKLAAQEKAARSLPDGTLEIEATVAALAWIAHKEPRTIQRWIETLRTADPPFLKLIERNGQAEQFMAWLKRAGLSNTSINNRRACLLALWRHAWRKRKVDDLPRDVPKYRVPKSLPDAWSIDELAELLKAAEAETGVVCGIAASDWWLSLILALFDSGIRLAAAMALKVSDVDLATRWLTVPAALQKQDADQYFRLHPQTIAVIERTRPDEREWLFPWLVDIDGNFRMLRKRFRKILERAGLPATRRDLFHKLRRTSGTAVADATDEQTASKHLGHSSLQVTKRYIDPRKLNRHQGAAEQMRRPDWRIVREDESENAAAG